MKLRGAIVGLGNIAVRGHLPAYRDGRVSDLLELVAVADVVPQSRPRAAELLPGARFYDDVGALLAAERVDFVDISAPPDTHAAVIAASAAKKIHVVCEKPLAENYRSVEAIAGTVREAGIAFVPCHQYKYSPLWRSIHDLIASGALGQVTLAQFNVYRLQADSGTSGWKPEWRTSKTMSGGGVLVDTGAHYFYLAQYFFGMPRRVSAILRTLKHRDYAVEDTAVVTLEYPSALVSINLTWAASSRANSIYIAGTAGSLSYDGTRLIATGPSGAREIPMPDVSDKTQYVGWYAALLAEFAHRAAAPGARQTDLLDEAVAVMKLLDLSYRSNDEGRMLDAGA